jgi:hypothetical protein
VLFGLKLDTLYNSYKNLIFFRAKSAAQVCSK